MSSDEFSLFLASFLSILNKKDLFPNQPSSFIPLFMPVDKAPRKKKPIIIQIKRSKKIKEEYAWPDLTISVSGSSGSKFLYIGISII